MVDGIKIVRCTYMVVVFDLFFLLLSKIIERDKADTMTNLKEIKNWRGTTTFLLLKDK